MIEELRIRDLALIEDAAMTFSPGLTVLTGETGAGKTALLGGIKLATGGRAESSLVRDGCGEAVVEAVFEIAPEYAGKLDEMGFAADDGVAVVKRRVACDGRSRCYVNDEMASVKGLSAVIGPLVDLHGQHEHQALLSPQNHVAYLDRWAADEVDAPKAEYAEAFGAYKRAKNELDKALEQAASSKFQIEQARFVCSQIDPVKPGENELEELEDRLPVLRNGESLATASANALVRLRGDGGAIELMSAALDEIERAKDVDPRLGELGRRLQGILAESEDFSMDLRAYGDDVEFDPEALGRALDRLGELDGLVRRFGPTYEAMLALWKESREIVESSDSGPARIDGLRSEVETAQRELMTAADHLRSARRSAARRFCSELARNVSELAMQGATFEIAEEELDLESWTSSGFSRYEILYAPAAGMSPRPLSRIASGGELSRVMLAMECMMDIGEGGRTLVFDEVDAGIGGSVANAVADRLAELATRQQVIVVTHLAQIASRAERHLLVSKSTDGVTASSSIRQIDGDERVAEIARMLSGTSDSAALAHARAMLEDATVRGGTSTRR